MSSPIETLNRYCSSEMESLRIFEDFILTENNLERISIKRSSSNLFSCLSYNFYSNDSFVEAFKKLCKSFLANLIQKNILPRRLKIFQNNSHFLQDYYANIDHSNFDLINLELISMIAQKKILIYEVDENTFLTCRVVNGNFENSLLLFCDKMRNYDVLVSMKEKLLCSEFRQTILEIIESALQANHKEPIKRNDSDSFFDQLNDDIKKFSLESEEVDFGVNNYILHESSEHFNQISPIKNDLPKPLLKMKSPPKLKVTSIKETDSLNNENDINFVDLTTGTNNKNITPLTFVKAFEDPPNFSWEGEISNDKNKNINSFSQFYSFNNYQFPQQQNEFLPRTNEKIPFLNNINNMIPLQSKSKPLVLEESNERFMGTLKFFDENKSFGFIIMDINNSEIFFHFDDFQQEEIFITKEFLMSYKNGNIIRLSFGCLKYIGKYNISLKAIEVSLVSIRKTK